MFGDLLRCVLTWIILSKNAAFESIYWYGIKNKIESEVRWVRVAPNKIVRLELWNQIFKIIICRKTGRNKCHRKCVSYPLKSLGIDAYAVNYSATTSAASIAHGVRYNCLVSPLDSNAVCCSHIVCYNTPSRDYDMYREEI